MIDKRVGKRFKEARENIKLTQEEFAEKIGYSVNYISRVERGASFPRYEKMIKMINLLETSADAIFCDVLLYVNNYKSTQLSERLSILSPEAQKRVLNILELVIQQELENKSN